MSQLPKVDCTYGAPMGRRECLVYSLPEGAKVRVFKVRIDSGGYDDGGAYWGIGEPLYCAYDDSGYEYVQYFRCANRDKAKELVLQQIPDAKFYR